MRVAVDAPAKVNLHLQVLGRRPDGFHEVRTLLQSIDLVDRLEVEEAPAGRLEIDVRPEGAAPADGDNLVLRAAAALARRTGVARGARFELVKRIPAGGGLGGGSADAAAALVALNRLWGLGLERVELAEVAASLGSDVPFFLTGGLALGVGRGEEVYPLADLPPLAVLVVVPEIQIPTVEVYGRLEPRLTWVGCEASVYSFAAGLVPDPCWERMRNDLEAVVIRGWPEIGEIVDRLRALQPRRAGVTGSGAASMAVFDTLEAAQRAGGSLGDRWSTRAVATLDRRRAALRAVVVGEN